jgi:hypothetical protein
MVEKERQRLTQPGSHPRPPLLMEASFYSRAEELWSQFENIVSSAQTNGGLTPFSYAFDVERFQFLTANSERLFARETLRDLIEKLTSWASDALGAKHVSTPQTRIYINGCGRNFLKDETKADWHYVFAITPKPRSRKATILRVIIETDAGQAGDRFRVDRVLAAKLTFNHLFVHPTAASYAVQGAPSSMNPVEGTVLLDGYMW